MTFGSRSSGSKPVIPVRGEMESEPFDLDRVAVVSAYRFALGIRSEPLEDDLRVQNRSYPFSRPILLKSPCPSWK
jgi:hypothetical protein